MERTVHRWTGSGALAGCLVALAVALSDPFVVWIAGLAGMVGACVGLVSALTLITLAHAVRVPPLLAAMATGACGAACVGVLLTVLGHVHVDWLTAGTFVVASVAAAVSLRTPQVSAVSR